MSDSRGRVHNGEDSGVTPTSSQNAPEDDLAAGNFAAWLADVGGTLRGEHDAEVPCHGCTACCTSSQFVTIGPDEADSLAHIPAELLFPAPRLPRGHIVLGYDEQGHCPMLVDDRCSIYEHRPRTCRTYDCRVFAAAGLGPDDDVPVHIAQRARRWRFAFPTPGDRNRHDAVRAAAAFLRGREGQQGTPVADAPSNATQLAARAIELHEGFLDGVDGSSAPGPHRECGPARN